MDRFCPPALARLATVAWLLLTPALAGAEFDPPRIVDIFIPREAATLPDSLAGKRMYHIDKGTRDNVETG